LPDYSKDEDLVVMKIKFSGHEQRMMADPTTFFITDRYLKYPMMIVRLSRVDVEDLEELLLGAWTHASN
jgi:hypothetical protein